MSPLVRRCLRKLARKMRKIAKFGFFWTSWVVGVELVVPVELTLEGDRLIAPVELAILHFS